MSFSATYEWIVGQSIILHDAGVQGNRPTIAFRLPEFPDSPVRLQREQVEQLRRDLDIWLAYAKAHDDGGAR